MPQHLYELVLTEVNLTVGAAVDVVSPLVSSRIQHLVFEVGHGFDAGRKFSL